MSVQDCKVIYDDNIYDCNICNKRIYNNTSCELTECKHTYHVSCLTRTDMNKCLVCNQKFYNPVLNFTRAWNTGCIFEVHQELHTQMTRHNNITCHTKTYI